MKLGDVCRAKCTAPARYLKDGRCLFIPVLDPNEFQEDDAIPPKGGEERFPLPTDEELQEWLKR